ncbi:MAG: DUF2278 family protein [Bacteroidetes bacterium]|nr:DUF2278 family protein [Bacteroidota bacterium]
MAVSSYGALAGTAIDKLDSPDAQKKGGGDPHYMILVDAGGEKYRLAVNVKSDDNPPDLQFYLDDDYKHPILDAVAKLPVGFTSFPTNLGPGSVSTTAALDYVRGNLFDLSELKILPATASGSGSNDDLNDIFDVYVSKAIATRGAMIYAFGSKWGPESKADAFFDFTPGNGVHDMHMNQGNSGKYSYENGVYTDGGLLIHFPGEQRWVAMFLKFQSQVVSTATGGGTTAGGGAVTGGGVPAGGGSVSIFAALVNPKSDDTGHEAVYLLNTSDADIDLGGWSIVDKLGNKETLSGSIAAGAPLVWILTGKGAQLSNSGGIITLLDKNGTKISGVSYTMSQASQQGMVIRF